MTDCSQQPLHFARAGGKAVVADFRGGRITTDAGALLLRQVESRIGLFDALDAAIPDPRRPELIEHDQKAMLAQRITAIALGYEDLNDHHTLRADPAVQVVAGRDPSPEATLASPSTLCRLENRVDRAAAARIAAVLVEQFIAGHAEPPEALILDFDATDDPVHGKQEGRFFHGYYDHHCYLPLYVFCGDHPLLALLRPANVDASTGALKHLQRIVARLRQVWPGVQILLRGDSGFCREHLMAWCAANRVDYLFGLAKNTRLLRLLAPELAQAAQQYQQSGQAARVFKDFTYRTLDSWSRIRRVIGKAEWTEGEANPRFIVTSLSPAQIDARRLYERIYCARGEMENRIKECQLDLFADRTSAATMRANQVRLWFASFAYVLLCALRRIGLAFTQFARASCGSIRLKLLKVGALVRVSVRRIHIAMASACPYQHEFALAHALLRRAGA